MAVPWHHYDVAFEASTTTTRTNKKSNNHNNNKENNPIWSVMEVDGCDPINNGRVSWSLYKMKSSRPVRVIVVVNKNKNISGP